MDIGLPEWHKHNLLKSDNTEKTPDEKDVVDVHAHVEKEPDTPMVTPDVAHEEISEEEL